MASGEGIGSWFDSRRVNGALVQARQVEVGLVHGPDLDHGATPFARSPYAQGGPRRNVRAHDSASSADRQLSPRQGRVCCWGWITFLVFDAIGTYVYAVVMIQTYFGAVRRFNRDIRLYLVATALLGFAVFSGIYPVLFNLYLLRLGYGTEFIGWANSVVMLTFAFCSPVAGMVSQIEIGGRPLGGRRTMVAGLSIVTAGYALLSIVEYMPRGLWSAWLMASGFVRAFGFALYWVNARPFLMSATSADERYHVYSVQAAITPLAGVLGSLVAGILPGLFAGWIGVSGIPCGSRLPCWSLRSWRPSPCAISMTGRPGSAYPGSAGCRWT